MHALPWRIARHYDKPFPLRVHNHCWHPTSPCNEKCLSFPYLVQPGSPPVEGHRGLDLKGAEILLQRVSRPGVEIIAHGSPRAAAIGASSRRHGYRSAVSRAQRPARRCGPKIRGVITNNPWRSRRLRKATAIDFISPVLLFSVLSVPPCFRYFDGCAAQRDALRVWFPNTQTQRHRGHGDSLNILDTHLDAVLAAKVDRAFGGLHRRHLSRRHGMRP